MATAQITQSTGGRFDSVVPILGWIRTYDVRRNLQPDVLAGVTVAAFTVPEGMAYASLAGLDPEIGLYASMVGMIVYAAFGSSREVSVGVTSAISIMIAGTLGGLALSDPDEYLAAAQVTAIVAGAFAVIAGVLRLGFIVNFISSSVLTGFSAGAALFIASSQLSKLFGIEGVQGNFFKRMGNLLRNLDETNGWSLALGLSGIALLLLLGTYMPRLPASLIVVLLSIGLMYVTDLEDRGVAVAGHIPSGLPAPGISDFPSGHLSELIGLSLGCFLLAYIEGIGAARTFAARHREKVNPGQELFATGAINLASGLFRGYPVGGGMSKSAVNDAAGSKTPLSSAFAAVMVGLVLLFLTGMFSKLPDPILAAVVLVAVKGLFDVPALRRLLRFSRIEFAAAAAAMAGVLLFGMLEGILIGAIFSVLAVIYRASNPVISILGRIPGTKSFSDLKRLPENSPVQDVLVFRVDGGIFYANVDLVKEELLRLAESQEPVVHLVMLDLDNTPMLDLAAIDMIQEITEELNARGIKLRIAGATGPVRDVLRKAGLADRIPATHDAMTVEQIVEDWEAHGAPPARRAGGAVDEQSTAQPVAGHGSARAT
jgi:SulP family sulfate permease